jgi:signal transduction histidine kinase
VLLQVDESEVLVRVRDDGSSAAPPRSGGHGLVGMRERAEILGGSFAAGPRAGGGFEVEAHLPLAEQP